MKISVLIFMQILLSAPLCAQKDVTQFLGIPVDGTKSEMIKKLKRKGYTTCPYDKNALLGEFNGGKVRIYIHTDNNKVYRIAVCDANGTSESNIKIRFNNLCRQFENNKKYISLSDNTIPEDEDISYGISVKKKRYEAVFYQKNAGEFGDFLLRKYTEEQVSNLTEEEVQKEQNLYERDGFDKRKVWFVIDDEHYKGGYYIVMFYVNEYNEANGEDL